MLQNLISYFRSFNFKPVPVKDSWSEKPSEFEGDLLKFQNWFDSTDSIENTLESGRQDWQFRFKSHPTFSKLQKKAALEIGFGGGRLLLHAAEDFEKVYGVDIHRAFATTSKFLESQGKKNFSLIHQSDLPEALESQTLDFVYSFIVFQHFSSIEEVEFYLQQCHRLLKPGGIGHIYYGKSLHTNRNTTTGKWRFKERNCSLFLTTELMRKMTEKHFRILETQTQVPKSLTRLNELSGQESILFEKV